MKVVGLVLSVLLLAACQPSNDDYEGLSGRVMLYQIDEDTLLSLLKEDAIIVIANPNSEWSQIAIPVLNRVALAANQRVEYFNGVSFRESNSPAVQSLIRQIQETTFLANFDARLYDELYMPLVIKVAQGQITLAHIGTVPGHRIVDGVTPPLTSEQLATLTTTYQTFFE